MYILFSRKTRDMSGKRKKDETTSPNKPNKRTPQDMVRRLSENTNENNGRARREKEKEEREREKERKCLHLISFCCKDHCEATILSALHFFEVFTSLKEKYSPVLNSISLRIGIASGPLVAGIIGKTKYAYDCMASFLSPHLFLSPA